MVKTHTIRVNQEQWEWLDAYAQATAKPGETPNVSAAVREAILAFMDRRPRPSRRAAPDDPDQKE